MQHFITRLSKIDEPWQGECFLCGKQGLQPMDAVRPCPNPKGITREQAIQMVIDKNQKPDDDYPVEGNRNEQP